MSGREGAEEEEEPAKRLRGAERDGAAQKLNAAVSDALPLFREQAVLDSVEWVLEQGDDALRRCARSGMDAAHSSWMPTLLTCGFASTQCGSAAGATRLLDAVGTNCGTMGVCVARRNPEVLMVSLRRDDCVAVLYRRGGDLQLALVRASAALSA